MAPPLKAPPIGRSGEKIWHHLAKMAGTSHFDKQRGMVGWEEKKYGVIVMTLLVIEIAFFLISYQGRGQYFWGTYVPDR